MSKILFISSEAFPLSKTGGLGDVAGSLPNALLKQQQDVRLVIPAYRGTLEKLKQYTRIAQTRYYGLDVSIMESRLPGTKLSIWLVSCPSLFDRQGGPYNDEYGNGWKDNALRFAVFCHAAVDLAMDTFKNGWQPELIHCNDWQTGLVPALLSLRKNAPPSVFTIHNLAYQGIFDQQTFSDLHLPQELWHIDGVEFYDQFSFIKGGLSYATKINTVSPTYAKEICTSEHGYGLDGLLTHRQQDLSGIINGIDTKHWNPGTDEYLIEKYNARSLNKKSVNKTVLQEELGLDIDAQIPLIGMVSRLVEQKGLEIILQSLPELNKLALQIVILGTGDTHFEIQLAEWASEHPSMIKVIIGYDEALAHRIEAACDIYMMPSRFEPCGLNQLYSLRYGSLPVVTAVGGLVDTVRDAEYDKSHDIINMNGFIMPSHDATGLISTIKRALSNYAEKKSWRQLQKNAMSDDHSWLNSAEQYIKLYQSALQK